MTAEAECWRWAKAEAARLVEVGAWPPPRETPLTPNPVRPAVLVRGTDEIVALAKELKRLGVKHFKDDTMELSFEREMKRPERPEGEF